jgi:hypothetical protein
MAGADGFSCITRFVCSLYDESYFGFSSISFKCNSSLKQIESDSHSSFIPLFTARWRKHLMALVAVLSRAALFRIELDPK